MLEASQGVDPYYVGVQIMGKSTTTPHQLQDSTPRVYAACLAAYNNGKLHGTWIDCNQDADSIREAIEAMLKTSPEPGAEEWAFHDYENWEGLAPSESQDIDTLAQWAELLVEHGEAFGVYASLIGSDYVTAEQFEESYAGEAESEEAFAEDIFFECHQIPDEIATYIDIEKYARDLFCTDYMSDRGDSGTLYIFRNI
jgi:antirestriction protein